MNSNLNGDLITKNAIIALLENLKQDAKVQIELAKENRDQFEQYSQIGILRLLGELQCKIKYEM